MSASVLAPTGRLRAAINFGNTVLALRGPTLEESDGVSVSIARELARRLGVPLTLIPFDGAGKVVAAAKDDVFDVAFMAVDPLRAGEVSFTAPYVLIEGGYLVRDDSPITSIEHVDKPGIRMTVGQGSAYDLFLTRNIKNAEIVRFDTGELSNDRFLSDGYDVAAGVKAALLELAKTTPGVRVLPGRFMVIEQAMVTVRGPEALAIISSLIEELKASGFIQRELDRTKQTEALVAPPASG